jgi:hypothetical protein
MRTTRWLRRGLQGALEIREVVVARPFHLLQWDHDFADGAGRGVDGDEARVAVGEVEVHRPVEARERVRAALVVEVVVADDADVRDRQRLHEPQVVLVPGERPRPAKAPRLAKNTGAGSSLPTWLTSWAKMASAVGSGQAPLSPATTKRNG